MPTIEHVNLRYAGQMKDGVLEYIAEHNKDVKSLQLDACNLISDTCWQKFFRTCGPKLETVKLSNLDCSFSDETVKTMVASCPNLRSLKLKVCWLPTDESLEAIATCTKLEHLSLDLVKESECDEIVQVIRNVGSNLQTLSLIGFNNADDRVLDEIHDKCRHISKLRISENDQCTDQGFARLFTNWDNTPLSFVDLSRTRDVDNSNPDGPEEAVGLASEGFKAMMAHSGERLEKLNISSCRHISHEALSTVFDGNNKNNNNNNNNKHQQFGNLKELDISFLTQVDDYLVGCIFQSCPAIKKVIAFGCFNVRDICAPAGVALVGGVNAHVSFLQ